MVILGLGTNLGDRLANLRKALQAIKHLHGIKVEQISPIYLSDALLPENAPPEWDIPYLNIAMRCHVSLQPDELLKELKNIEWSIGRKPEIRHWGPRIIDIDILAWDDRIIKTDALTVPHENLQNRPFALWPLADVAPFWQFPLPGSNHGKTAAEIGEQWGPRESGEAPLHTRQLFQRIDTPELVGVINITPDSFSDGGYFLDVEKAYQQISHLMNSGATIIDIGAESTAPNAKPLSSQEEWTRLSPLLTIINEKKRTFLLPPKISVDTRHADVAEKALAMSVDWINDVTGLNDPTMQKLIAQSKADCVVMHHMSIPASRQYILPRIENSVDKVLDWAKQKIEALVTSDIAKERIIIDPGIGFGKVPEQSFMLIKHINRFAELGCRLLVGHSRKSFLTWFTSRPPAERDIETLALTLYLAKQPVDYLRVHNVEMNARALRVASAL